MMEPTNAPEEEMMDMEAEAPMAEEPMVEEAPVEDGPDMEMLMGNFLDLPDKERQLAQRIILSPMAKIIDTILGTPTFSRLNAQLGDGIKADAPTDSGPATQEAGMMAPPEAPAPEMPEEPEV